MQTIKKYNPDAILLSETKLNDNHFVEFAEYECIRTDRPNSKQGGGTDILIRKNIKHIQNSKLMFTKSLETIIIKLQIKNNQYFYLVSAYSPCKYNSVFLNELENVVDILQLDRPENYYYLAENLNAKHITWSKIVAIIKGETN